jgi:ubiquitin-protein ligase
MPSPRTRRLLLDYQTLTTRLANWPLIQITGTAGIPPEIYRFSYNIRGLYVSPGGEILERNVHLLEVNLSLGYPRRAPQCRMLTPLFHPNFDDSQVCIGDFWAASEGLDDLVTRIGRMICFQEYNVKSPLNGLAAKWVEQNRHLLPIDSRSIAPPSQTASEVPPLQASAKLAQDQTPNQALESAQDQAPEMDSSPQNIPPETPIDPWSQKISIS